MVLVALVLVSVVLAMLVAVFVLGVCGACFGVRVGCGGGSGGAGVGHVCGGSVPEIGSTSSAVIHSVSEKA